MLKNPAYKGVASFGKTRVGERRPQLRPLRNRTGQSRRVGSTYDTLPGEQEQIPVPAIISEDLFAAAAEQLAENRKRSRQRKRGARYLLQGLTVCKCCGYAYYGKHVSRASAKGKQPYAYYRCVGTDAYRFGGERVCANKQVRTDMLDDAVWQDVRSLLSHPERVAQEYQRRLNRPHSRQAKETTQLACMIQKVKRGLGRLIDAYEDGLLSKDEFEPRVRTAKQRLLKLEEEAQAAEEQVLQERELHLVIGQFEEFAKKVREGLRQPDWTTRREIIRALVKRVEVDREHVRVIYKVNPPPFVLGPHRGRLQDCWRRAFTFTGERVLALRAGRLVCPRGASPFARPSVCGPLRRRLRGRIYRRRGRPAGHGSAAKAFWQVRIDDPPGENPAGAVPQAAGRAGAAQIGWSGNF